MGEGTPKEEPEDEPKNTKKRKGAQPSDDNNPGEKEEAPRDMKEAYWNFIHAEQKRLKAAKPDLSPKEILALAREGWLGHSFKFLNSSVWFCRSGVRSHVCCTCEFNQSLDRWKKQPIYINNISSMSRSERSRRRL